MKTFAVLIAVVGLPLAAADDPKDKDAKTKALEKYQGSWHLDKIGDGPAEFRDKAKLMKSISFFDGDGVRSKAGDKPLLGRIDEGGDMYILDQNDLLWIKGDCKVDGDRLSVRYFYGIYGEAVNWRMYVDVVYLRDKN
ncbi:MAG TPA: hypothetical protein VMS17_03905 [Gemmataceae bacterium]|nr:hypothetical protein [Gemmataceae bacterium]